MVKFLYAAAILLLVASGVWFFAGEGKSVGEQSFNQEPLGEPAITIVRTADGYEPKEVTITQGDIVLFTNESGDFHWPASDLHPSHGVYPAFDPKRPIANGEEWKFRFDNVGVWKFHDHLRANKTGTVTVTE